jgi:hypothetical protein
MRPPYPPIRPGAPTCQARGTTGSIGNPDAFPSEVLRLCFPAAPVAGDEAISDQDEGPVLGVLTTGPLLPAPGLPPLPALDPELAPLPQALVPPPVSLHALVGGGAGTIASCRLLLAAEAVAAGAAGGV